MRFLLISSILLSLLLAGCTSNKIHYIHLVHQGVPQTKIDKLTSSLMQQGYRVELSDILIPQNFANTAISINPGTRDFQGIADIKRSLTDLAFLPATEYRFAQGRHFYNTQHVGIYLKSSNQKPTMPLFIATDACPNIQATLMFPTGASHFILEFDTDENDQLIKVEGEWRLSADILSLQTSTGLMQEFHYSRQKKATPFGIREADVYTPRLPDNQLAAFNCEFSIIYMS